MALELDIPYSKLVVAILKFKVEIVGGIIPAITGKRGKKR